MRKHKRGVMKAEKGEIKEKGGMIRVRLVNIKKQGKVKINRKSGYKD